MPREKPRPNPIDRLPFVLAFAVTVGLILYGSFYPFEFYNYVDPARGMHHLLATWKQLSSLGDILANVLLYLPFGLFAAKAMQGMAPPVRIFACFLGGAALSLSVEFTQLYDIGRVSAMSDVYANSLGALLGAIAGTALSTNFQILPWSVLRRRPFAPFLIFCWLAYRLFPYVPVIDLHKYWHAVRPLLQGPNPNLADLLRHLASWLAVGALLESVWGPVKARYCLPPLVMSVFCARIGIADIVLSRAEIIGGFAAAAIWVTWLHAEKRRKPIIAAALAVAVLVEALQPFHFLTPARPFGWVPFVGFIDGSTWTAVPSLMSKFFLYGALVWSLFQLGLRWIPATAAAAAFVFLVHYLQIFLPGRSAEITDALLVLMAGALMKTLDGETEPEPEDSGSGGLKPDDIWPAAPLERVSRVNH